MSLPFGRSLLVLLAAVLSALHTEPAQAESFQLQPRYEGGYGDLGLYLGPSDWRGRDNIYFNWEFTDVAAELRDDGELWISGTMERLYDRAQYGEGVFSWGIDIQLREIVLVGETFAGHTGSYEGVVAQLMASDEAGARIEWRELGMELHAPYDTAVPATGWIGLAMPEMGHPNVAELRNVDGVLRYDAWYQNPDSPSRWYVVGDTKADGTLDRDPIPEPGAATVFVLGLLLVARSLRR